MRNIGNFAFVLPLAVVSILPATAQQQPRTQPGIQQQLIHSVLQDESDNVRALLSRGANPNAHAAFAKGDQWFYANQPNIDPAPPVIVLACRFQSIKGDSAIIKILLDKGARVNSADSNGVTPLMGASQLGGAVRLLLERGANVNAVDKTGRTPLMYAMNNYGAATAGQLLGHGANINAADNRGETALMLAVRDARQSLIHLIGEDEKQKDIEAKASYLELVQFLIDKGANVNARDKAGNTALAIALNGGSPEAAALLKKAGALEVGSTRP